MEEARRALVRTEGMRLLFEQNGVAETALIRPLHVMAVTAAALIGAVVRATADLPVSRIVAWCAIIFVGETLITALNRAYAARRPDDAALPRWAALKTALSIYNALAWSLGVVLLHVPGGAAAVIAPTWGVFGFMAATVFVAASFPPAMYSMMFAVGAPAAAALIFLGGPLETTVGVCIALTVPYMMGIGSLSMQKAREAMLGRIDVAELLATKQAQADQIGALFADRTRFFSAASHDLRQPLSAMGYYFALLERAETASARNEIVARLQECADSLRRQFDSIMGVSEADSAIMRAADVDVDLQKLFDRVAVTLGPDAARKGVRLRIAPTRLVARADPDLVYRVLINIAGNAVKYTSRGSVLIGARRRGEGVAVQVVDTGVGVARGQLAAIFDDYFQIGNPERDLRKGLGIGLGVVKRICDAMGWRLDVRSEPGRGTSFAVTLPRSGDTTLAGADPRAADVPDAPDATHVLVVDDDPLVCDSLSRLLTSWGHVCRACANGPAALDAIAREAEAIAWRALIDWRLAGETGLDVAIRLRETFGDRVRITLMTGDTDPAIAQAAREAGLPLLRKPVQPIRLRAALATPADPP
ncbi:MAG TPA: hybrid sensor histidine kinase/response regulator [Rhodoblastus sp.]|nr:hybrid sensor histidine kinase/response regulator [Rhodoblastus sp.]